MKDNFSESVSVGVIMYTSWGSYEGDIVKVLNTVDLIWRFWHIAINLCPPLLLIMRDKDVFFPEHYIPAELLLCRQFSLIIKYKIGWVQTSPFLNNSITLCILLILYIFWSRDPNNIIFIIKLLWGLSEVTHVNAQPMPHPEQMLAIINPSAWG